MQLMYTRFVLLQPAQRRRDHDVVKTLFSTVRSNQTDWTRFADQSLYRNHDGAELNVRLGKRNCSDPGSDLLIVGWYEAVICKN